MSDTATTGSDTQAVIDAALASAKPTEIQPGKMYAVVVPAGGSVEEIDLDLDTYREVPRRKTGTVDVHDSTSFVTYFKEHSEGPAEHSVYADVSQQALIGVLNGHVAEGPGWADHLVCLVLTRTPAWQRWIGKDRQLLPQVAFAEHIEESLLDIIEPPAAEMLEIAQSFQATTKVAFESGTRLNSGQQQLTYVEETGAKAGRKGELTMPQTFTLALQPFDGSPTYNVTARLRYRIGDGQLRLGYYLDRPDEVARSAFLDILTEVEKGTGAKALRGVPAR